MSLCADGDLATSKGARREMYDLIFFVLHFIHLLNVSLCMSFICVSRFAAFASNTTKDVDIDALRLA